MCHFLANYLGGEGVKGHVPPLPLSPMIYIKETNGHFCIFVARAKKPRVFYLEERYFPNLHKLKPISFSYSPFPFQISFIYSNNPFFNISSPKSMLERSDLDFAKFAWNLCKNLNGKHKVQTKGRLFM